MRIKWFGEPWPSETDRAPVCEDDVDKIDTPVGRQCLYCDRKIAAGDRGLVMAASPEIEHSFDMTIKRHVRRVAVSHLSCFLRVVLGPPAQLADALLDL